MILPPFLPAALPDAVFYIRALSLLRAAQPQGGAPEVVRRQQSGADVAVVHTVPAAIASV